MLNEESVTDLQCSIIGEMIFDPVITCDGQLYEKNSN